MVRLFQSRGIFAAVARLRLATLPVDSCQACSQSSLVTSYIVARLSCVCQTERPPQADN